jgi:phage I-like protein
VIASAGIELPDAPGPIKLFPFGAAIWGRDGRGPYLLPDAATAGAVLDATRAYQAGADLPIDYDHQTQRAAANGQPAPASGWVNPDSLEIRDDGIYGRPDWTKTAARRIAAREYRYFSPAWIGAGPGGTGAVLRLVGGGLTNQPNFALPALASQGEIMDPELIKALGLPADSAPAVVTAHAAALAAGAGAVARLLGLAESTPPAQLVTAAQAAVGQLTAAFRLDPAAVSLPALVTAAQRGAPTAPNPAEWVPMAVHQAVAGQLAASQRDAGVAAAAQAVDAAIVAGKVTPAARDWALGYAGQDPAGFAAYVAAAPVLVGQSAAGPTAAPPPATAAALTAEEQAVASQLGLTVEQIRAGKGDA